MMKITNLGSFDGVLIIIEMLFEFYSGFVN